MNVSFISAAVAACLAFSASAGLADTVTAELTEISGKVLVNTGKGYHLAKPDEILAVGNEVFVAHDASAALRFAKAKCEVVLAPTSITRIDEAMLCHQASSSNAVFRGIDGEVVITPVNGTIIPAAGGPSGIISPYYIAGGIFAINAAAFTNAMLSKDAPVSAP